LCDVIPGRKATFSVATGNEAQSWIDDVADAVHAEDKVHPLPISFTSTSKFIDIYLIFTLVARDGLDQELIELEPSKRQLG